MVKKQPLGFGYAGLLIVIVVLAIIGLVGWKVAGSKHTSGSSNGYTYNPGSNSGSQQNQGQVAILSSFNPADVPPITANPVQLDQIFAISLFRSDAGHDYSYSAWDGETCRSMKHYFNWSQNQGANNMPLRSQPTAGHPDIDVYAPFDGTIIENDQEQVPIGTQVHIASAKNPAYYVRLFHIDLLPSLKVGSTVKSGQLVGTIGPKDGMDVSYEGRMNQGKTVYLSIFDYMTSQAFAPYAALGHKPGDFVLSQAQADAKHYQCSGESFVNSSNTSQMEGFVSLRANPYAQ